MLNRRVRLSPHATAAGPFGQIRIAADAWPSIAAVVDAPGAPTVTVRVNGTLAMEGRRLPISTGPGLDPRRSARTWAVLAAGHRYELRPSSLRRPTR